jgi:hypothetical protein
MPICGAMRGKKGEYSMSVIKTIRYENDMWEMTHNSTDKKWYWVVKDEERKRDFCRSMYVDEAEMKGLIELLAAVKEEI